MKRIRIDNSQETLILTGMVVSDRFLRDVQVVLDVRKFKSTHSRKIAKWCLEYFEENNKSPGVHIQDVFNLKVETDQIDEDESQLIARSLARISKEFDRAKSFNIDYVLKLAENYFGKEDLIEICEKVLEMADKDTTEAIQVLEQYRAKKLPSSVGVDPFSTPDLIHRAFEESSEPIMKLPGALGRMMNPDLCRGSFIALMGQEKIGKTWNLMDIVFHSLRNRLNTVFFQAGDMSEDQQIRRMMIRLAGRSNKAKYCGDVLIPVYDCSRNQDDSCDMKQRTSSVGIDIASLEDLTAVMKSHRHKETFFDEKTEDGYEACDYCRRSRPHEFRGGIWWERQHKEVLTWPQAARHAKRFSRRNGASNFKMVTYPNDHLAVSTIRTHLDNWTYYEGFAPDVIVIDYADIMAADPGQLDFRHGQNKIWKGLRALSQEYNCLVVTATQADADAYGKESLGLKNFSEDKRKFAHVTSMFSLNQTPAEKVAGILRYGQLVIRDEDFDSRSQVKVLQCYSIGKAHIGSFI